MSLVDEEGRPLDARLERTLLALVPRLKRCFPSIRDDATTTRVLEESARRVSGRERKMGGLERLNGYAWVTLKSVASSHLRRGESQVARRSIGGVAGERILAGTTALSNTHRDIERRVLAGQLLSAFTPGERRVCLMKHAGYTTREIAHALGRSAVSVDTMYCRARAKARRMAAEHVSSMPRRSGSRYPGAR